jgi:hypothetical protein
VLRWFRGPQSWLEMKGTTRRTRWWGCGHKTGVREGRTTGKRLCAGQNNFDEEYWSLGETIDRDRAQSRFSGGGGALWANARALDGVGLAGHRAGAASKCDRTPARPNWLKAGANRETKHGNGCLTSGRSSGSLGVASDEREDRHGGRGSLAKLSDVGRARERVGLCEMGRGSECKHGRCSKRSYGRARATWPRIPGMCMSARLLVHGGARGRQN